MSTDITTIVETKLNSMKDETLRACLAVFDQIPASRDDMYILPDSEGGVAEGLKMSAWEDACRDEAAERGL